MSFKNRGDKDRGNDFYKTSKTDFVIIAFVLSFSLTCIFGFTHERLRQSGSQKTAFIYQENKILEKFNPGEDRIINLPDAGMQVEVKGKRMRVIKAECPQHVCMNMGWIQYGGETLVCAPNKVVIEIKSAGAPAVDATVY